MVARNSCNLYMVHLLKVVLKGTIFLTCKENIGMCVGCENQGSKNPGIEHKN